MAIVSLCAASVSLAACGDDSKPARGDANAVQSFVDRTCGERGVEALTAVGHGSRGRTSGFIVVCKSDPQRIYSLGLN